MRAVTEASWSVHAPQNQTGNHVGEVAASDPSTLNSPGRPGNQAEEDFGKPHRRQIGAELAALLPPHKQRSDLTFNT